MKTIVNGVKTEKFNQVDSVNYSVQGLNEEEYDKLYLALCNEFSNVNTGFVGHDWSDGLYYGYIHCFN